MMGRRVLTGQEVWTASRRSVTSSPEQNLSRKGNGRLVQEAAGVAKVIALGVVAGVSVIADSAKDLLAGVAAGVVLGVVPGVSRAVAATEDFLTRDLKDQAKEGALEGTDDGAMEGATEGAAESLLNGSHVWHVTMA